MTDESKELDVQAGASAAAPDPAGDPAPAAPAGELDLQAEVARYHDLLLRKTAEFDNYRKRIERERREWVDGAAGDVIGELLPVVDDLERALKTDASGEQAEAYRRGVELILKRLLDTLRKRGVEPVDSVGQPFDPHHHQAVSYEPVPGKPDGEVIEEFARGYRLGSRLLRPAMVKVAKA
jgi:molecular chaperone GrpE